MKNRLIIENTFRRNIPVFGISGGVVKVSQTVQCVLDAHPKDSVGDTGNCPGFVVACTSNLQDYCNTGFALATTGQLITDESVQGFYAVARAVANDRHFTTVATPSTITDNAIIDNNHHDVLKNWLDGTFGFSGVTVIGSTQTENVGDIIDAAGWTSIRDKLKNMAKLCNDVSHCDCNKVCSCNTVCTCNCDSNY